MSTTIIKAVGEGFLRGEDIADLAQFHGLHRRRVEAIIRAMLQAVVNGPMPSARAEADALVNRLTEEAQLSHTDAEP